MSTANLERLRARANHATIGEAAEILGVSAGRLYQAIARGALPARRRPMPVRVGRGSYVERRPALTVDLEDVEAWLDAMRAPPQAHEVLRLHDWGYTLDGIAQALGATRSSVQRLLERRGVQPRGLLWTRKNREAPPCTD